MLSWDDFNSEETQKTPVAEPAKAQVAMQQSAVVNDDACLLYTSPSPRD